MASSSSKSINPDIAEERAKASFDPVQIATIVHGGKEKYETRKELIEIVESEPTFNPKNKIFMNRDEEYNRAFSTNSRFLQIARERGLGIDEGRTLYYLIGEHAPMTGLHHGMFLPTLMNQSTPEQFEKWGIPAMALKIIGTYAQTEAGHGTFLRGIETTATFDESTDEFVLETPHLTSMKWWPGALGKTATHCILMARLIVKGKDLGVHPFVLQIRSMDDHKLLPGVETGDIGRKMGWNAIDNGYMRLHKVRIPRENMLMKYSKLDRQGNYTKPPHSKIAYGTMIIVRVGMIEDAFRALSKAITIAIRYSVVRRQGYGMGVDKQTEASTKEWKILDYGLQAHSLFTTLADAYALKFASLYITDLYQKLQNDIKTGDFSGLAEVHATSAGLKAFATVLAVNGCEECRRRCGGHGFLRSSGLPDVVLNATPSITYEGEFQPMLQQTARYLFRTLNNLVTKGQKAAGNADYLNLVPTLDQDKCNVKSVDDLFNSDTVFAIYRHKAARLVSNAQRRMQEEMKAGKTWAEAWNFIQPDMIEFTKAHVYLILVKGFIHMVEQQPERTAPHVIALTRLRNLFALSHLQNDLSSVLIDGYFSNAQAELLRKTIKLLLAEIRPDAVTYVDSFELTDNYLNSALGRFDGQVYEALYQKALEEPFNKAEVLPTYKYIKEFTSKL